jgi:hypothetical protein
MKAEFEKINCPARTICFFLFNPNGPFAKNSKLQAPSSREIPNFKFQNKLARELMLGCWMLDVGVSCIPLA